MAMFVSFILVNPAVPENVGAAARAIKTMGFSDLRLINPCDYLCDKAMMLAHGSHDILHSAKVFNSLAEALVDIDFSVATSAKLRWVKQNVISSREIKNFLEKKRHSINRIAIVFGGEESGLPNEDIALCDRVASIPIADPYPSLNLAQAVMVFAYSLAEIEILAKETAGSREDNQGFRALKEKVIYLLNLIGITENSLVQGRVLERLTEISNEDVNLLHSVTAKVIDRIGNLDAN